MEPWRAKLADGDSEAAWGHFIDRYRRLVLAVIRRTVEDAESVMDAFAHVCGELSAHDLARLRRYDGRSARDARFSTWLVAVVHNLTVDWLRRRDGRRRLKPPAGLSPIQRQIFARVFVEGRSHAEAYELVRSAAPDEVSYGSFLKELADTYRAVEEWRPRGVMHYLGAPPGSGAVTEARAERRAARAETRNRLADALASLPPDTRLCVQLFVLEDLPAADVARTLGWPNAKAVYNRVYRALASLRAALNEQGVGPTDL